MGFKLDAAHLENKLNEMEKRAMTAIEVFSVQGAHKLESCAKNNAPWTDRSGRARGSLRGYVEHRYNLNRLCLSHGVSYGIWLELAHEKRFAIIDKTINYVGVFEIMPAFENLLEKI